MLFLGGCAGSPGSASDPNDAVATSDQLVGRWVPTVADAAPAAFLDLAGDGSLTLSDGCNGAQGEWSIGSDGAFSASAGPSTKMFCDGLVAIGTMLDQTESARIREGLLVLIGPEGASLGEFTPDTTGAQDIDGIGDGPVPTESSPAN
jgi:heat shock protein HslJ